MVMKPRASLVFVIGIVLSLQLATVFGLEDPVSVEQRLRGRDTLDVTKDENADAEECLAGLRWDPHEFDIHFEDADRRKGDILVRFPSAVETGDAVNDLVAMEWYWARDREGKPTHAPAVVVVHESGRGMEVGRLIAKGLAIEGLHALMIQLPGYGKRDSDEPQDDSAWLHAMRQAIADVRRARDVVTTLPTVDSSVIGLQGTSLGGFICATVAGVDRGYDKVFVLLAGGNIEKVITEGERDAEGLRRRLEAVGIVGERLTELTRQVEPMRVAHRVNADNTWLYTGRHDNVVPPECSHAWAEAVGLPQSHYTVMEADHYTGVIFLPRVLAEMYEHTTGKPLVVETN